MADESLIEFQKKDKINIYFRSIEGFNFSIRLHQKKKGDNPAMPTQKSNNFDTSQPKFYLNEQNLKFDNNIKHASCLKAGRQKENLSFHWLEFFTSYLLP